ncbi:uncharacterized protein LOC120209249 [Hibiscus syriacus]|uniref:uncharacterized protein LOC120209249 n=1 Tax=Hibiscus syriacus TaxID=106335 RepID=UPI001920CB7E|nr:uncharacterized protein LOC120209249 [Hibiscus syriacus]
MECAEGGEISMDKESQSRKPPKCTVAIFDTYTHTIVQTVFHGNLSNGPLKFMDNVSSVDDGENHFSLMADSFGKLQLVPLPKDFHQDSGEGEIRLQRSSKQEIMTLEDGFVEAGQVVSIATCRTIVATVIKDRSILRLLGSGIIIGLILFMNNVLCIEDKHGQAHVIGAMFLKSKNYGQAQTARLSFSFVQLSQILLRIESVCFTVEDQFQWKLRVTIWSLKWKHDHAKLFHEWKMLGEGISFLGLTSAASLDHKNESLGGCNTR